MTFRDNGLDPAEHDLRQAAVMPETGLVTLAGAKSAHEYGHYVAMGLDGLVRRLRHMHASRKASAVGFRELLEKYPTVDLVDMDIQGMEAQTLDSVSRELLERVRIIHVGTHSRKIERELTRIFTRIGWRNVFSFPGHSENDTPFGMIAFPEDGVQTWVNPAAESAIAQMLTPCVSVVDGSARPLV
jgi:FkbM family methyltransferase